MNINSRIRRAESGPSATARELHRQWVRMCVVQAEAKAVWGVGRAGIATAQQFPV